MERKKSTFSLLFDPDRLSRLGLTKDNLLTAEQLMWQQRDQELALTRERERAAKEKERQRREGEGIWSTTGIGGVLNDHIELDKESYSYVQFAREGNQRHWRYAEPMLCH